MHVQWEENADTSQVLLQGLHSNVCSYDTSHHYTPYPTLKHVFGNAEAPSMYLTFLGMGFKPSKFKFKNSAKCLDEKVI